MEIDDDIDDGTMDETPGNGFGEVVQLTASVVVTGSEAEEAVAEEVEDTCDVDMKEEG